MLVKSILIVSLATLALARDAVLSRGVFTGSDTTEKDASIIEIFKRPKNHAAATASILRFAAEKTDFLPYQMTPAKLSEKFDHWTDKVNGFPGFIPSRHPKPEDVNMEGGDEKLGKALNRGLQALAVPDASDIAMEIIHLVPEKLDDRSLKDFVFNVIVLDKPEDHKKVMVRLIELHMKLDTNIFTKKVSIPDQTIRLRLREMEVNTDVLISHADKFAKIMPRSDVGEFMWLYTSPKEQDAFDDWIEQSVIHRLRNSRLSKWMEGY